MKKILFAAAAIAVLASCTQEMNNIEPQQPKGQTVTIEANLEETKAAVGKDGVNVMWRDFDEITVLVKKSDNTFTANTRFERIPEYDTDGTTPKKDVDGKIIRDKNLPNTFVGTFNEELPTTGATTWYLLNPYNKNITGIGNESAESTLQFIKEGSDKNYSLRINNKPQECKAKANPMGHVDMPLYAIATSEGNAVPNLTMKHLSCIFRITVNNPGDKAISVKKVILSNKNNHKFSGSFRINVTENGFELVNGSGSYTTAELEVLNSSIPAKGNAEFNIMAAPTEMKIDETISIEVITDNDFVKKDIVLTADKNFEAGKIHRTSVDYINPTPLTKAFNNPGTIDFSKLKAMEAYMELDGAGQIKFENGGAKLTKNSALIITTANVPQSIEVTPVEYGVNGHYATLNIYASTDGKTWGKPIATASGETMKNLDGTDNKKFKNPATSTLITINKIPANAKVFKFESITPEKDPEVDGNKANRCAGFTTIEFK